MCLFERNGLGHGSFLVKQDDAFQIQQAVWSPDSAILAIAAACGVRPNQAPLPSTICPASTYTLPWTPSPKLLYFFTCTW